MRVIILLITVMFFSFSSQTQAQKKKNKKKPKFESPISKTKLLKTKEDLQVYIIQANDTIDDMAIVIKSFAPAIVEDSIDGVGELSSIILKNAFEKLVKDNKITDVESYFTKTGFTIKANASELNNLSSIIGEIFGGNEFDKSSFDKEKKAMASESLNRRDSVSKYFNRLIRRLSYGDYPLGALANQETVSAINSSDVEKYLRKIYDPQVCQVYIASPTNVNQAYDIVVNSFEKWIKRPSKLETYKEEDIEKNIDTITQLSFIHDGNLQGNSYIGITNFVRATKSPIDYFSGLVALKLLKLDLVPYEGEISSEEIPNLIFEQNNKVAYFASYITVSSDKIKEGVQAFITKMETLQQQGIDDNSLKEAKDSIVSEFKQNMVNKEFLATTVLEQKNIPLDKKLFDEYIERVKSVSKEGVMAFASKYFPIASNKIVVLGNGKKVFSQIKNLVKKEWADELRFYDYKADSIGKPPFVSPLPSGITLNKVIADYINAIGGYASVNNIKSQKLEYKSVVNTVEMKTIVKRTIDNQFFSDIKIKGNTLNKQVVDKDKGYMISQPYKGGYMGANPKRMLLKPNEIKLIKQSMELLPEARINDNAKLKYVETIDNKDYYVVAFDDIKYSYYSVNTHLKYKDVIYETINTKKEVSAIFYDKYETVSGVKFPKKISQEYGTVRYEFDVVSMKVNEDVSNKDFEIPKDLMKKK